MKKTNPWLYVLLALIVVLALVPVGVAIFSDAPPIAIKELSYDFEVKDSVGFVLENDALHFGGGPPGATMQRNITLSAPYDAEVEVRYDGPGVLRISENNFFIHKGEDKVVDFTLVVPSLEYGKYGGKVFFRFHKP